MLTTSLETKTASPPVVRRTPGAIIKKAILTVVFVPGLLLYLIATEEK